MSDWQVGDLAVCVNNDPCSQCGHADPTLTVGSAYAVGGVETEFGDTWLYLPAVPPSGCAHWCVEPWFSQSMFRKIRPDAREACEAEFLTLLKRSKRKVSA